MNGIQDGYLMFFLLLLSFILLSTGWNREIADGLRVKYAALFLAVFFVLQPIGFVVYNSLFVHASVIWTSFISFILLVRERNYKSYGYVMFCGLLLGMFWLWTQALCARDPLLVVFSPRFDLPLVCGILTTLLVMRAAQQFVVITTAMAVKGIAQALWFTEGRIVELGALEWWDHYVLALAAARSCSIVIQHTRDIAAFLTGIRKGDV